MKKKLLLSLVSVTILSLGMNTAAPVFAAELAGSETNSSAPAASTASDNTSTSDQAKPATPGSSAKKPAKNSGDTAKALQLFHHLAQVTKKSYVYNDKGKRIKNRTVKKGTVIGITGFTTVKGKTLLGFNLTKKKTGYVKVNNVKRFRAVSYKTKKKAYVYNKKGKMTGYYIAKGKRVPISQTKKIHGVKYAGSADNNFVKWSVLDHASAKVASE